MELRVARIKELRQDRWKRYTPLMRERKGWYYGPRASFVLNISRDLVDPDWCMNLVLRRHAPELWLKNRGNLYTLRVSRKFGDDVKRRLYWRGFRYNKTKRAWFPKKNFNWEGNYGQQEN